MCVVRVDLRFARALEVECAQWSVLPTKLPVATCEARSFLKVHAQEQTKLAVKGAVSFCQLYLQVTVCFRTQKSKDKNVEVFWVILPMQRLCARQHRSTPTAGKGR